MDRRHLAHKGLCNMFSIQCLLSVSHVGQQHFLVAQNFQVLLAHRPPGNILEYVSSELRQLTRATPASKLDLNSSFHSTFHYPYIPLYNPYIRYRQQAEVDSEC